MTEIYLCSYLYKTFHTIPELVKKGKLRILNYFISTRVKLTWCRTRAKYICFSNCHHLMSLFNAFLGRPYQKISDDPPPRLIRQILKKYKGFNNFEILRHHYDDLNECPPR